MYSYCYVCSVLGILFYCDVLCIVCVYMCTVLLPPGGYPISVNKYIISYIVTCGLGNVVSIATSYRLDGPGIEKKNPGWGEILCTCPDRPWVSPSLLYNGYRVFPGGKERPGRDADTSPPSSAVGLERVELYLYSPYGPYGLYKASVPIEGCTLPLLTYL
jgi:hypothetical protein